MNSRMWYCKPASEWQEGLPIGNGLLAGMVMGTFPSDRLALNHEWLWRANIIHSMQGQDCRLLMQDETPLKVTADGAVVPWSHPVMGRIAFQTEAGKAYSLLG